MPSLVVSQQSLLCVLAARCIAGAVFVFDCEPKKRELLAGLGLRCGFLRGNDRRRERLLDRSHYFSALPLNSRDGLGLRLCITLDSIADQRRRNLREPLKRTLAVMAELARPNCWPPAREYEFLVRPQAHRLISREQWPRDFRLRDARAGA